MNTRKLLKKISYGLVVAVVIVLIGFLVYQQRQIRLMSQNEEQAPPAAAVSDSITLAENNTSPPKVAETGRDQLATEVDNLRYQLEASEEELEMAREDLANNQGGPGDVSNLIAMEKKMQENPTLMNMRRRDSENMLNKTHGALFEKLGLPDDKLQALKTLMVDNEMQGMQVSLGMMDQSLPEEERKEILQQLEDQNAEFEKQVKELLGTEGYETYSAYQERLNERFFVHEPFNPLSEDLGISDGKEQELIDAMYEARKKVEADYDTDSWNETPGSASQNPEDPMDRMLKTYDAYIESAEGILSESQAEQFETRVNEMKEMMKMNRVVFRDSDDDESQ